MDGNEAGQVFKIGIETLHFSSALANGIVYDN